MKIAVAGGTGAVGSHVTRVAAARGHEVTVLARATGIDLRTGAGLAARLDAVEVVIDVLSVSTQSAEASVDFFRTTTTTLLDAERAAGTPHHVALSIVGIDRAPEAYYAGKIVQEQLVVAGRVPWTILRATQFHEFAEQMFHRTKVGPLVLAPHARTQPIAAREVAEHLLELATGPAQGRATELAGPREEDLADMVKSYADAVEHRGPVLAVKLPGAQMKGMREGLNLPGANAVLGSQTFAEWVASAS